MKLGTMQRIMIVAILAISLVTTSCATVRGERVESGVATQEEAITPAVLPLARPVGNAIAVNNVQQAGAFSFLSTALESRMAISGMELVADGPVVMTFVVPHCPICISEAPTIAHSAAENQDVTYVIVHSGGVVADYLDFNEDSGLNLPNVVHLDDSAGVLWARFGVIQQPTNILVDARGDVTQALGALGSEELEGAISVLRQS